MSDLEPVVHSRFSILALPRPPNPRPPHAKGRRKGGSENNFSLKSHWYQIPRGEGKKRKFFLPWVGREVSR